MFKKIAFIICFSLMLSSCWIPAYSRVVHLSYPVSSGGSIKLYNTTGNIVITTWEGNCVDISTTKKSSLSYEELQKVEIQVTGSNPLIIRTVYLENANVGVDYEIKIPAGISLDYIENITGNISLSGGDSYVNVKTTTGNISVSDTTGDLIINCITGNINVNVSNENYSAVTANVITGNINAHLEPALNADMELNVTTGNITNYGLAINCSAFSNHHLSGTMGSGGINFQMSTVTGNINLYSM